MMGYGIGHLLRRRPTPRPCIGVCLRIVPRPSLHIISRRFFLPPSFANPGSRFMKSPLLTILLPPPVHFHMYNTWPNERVPPRDQRHESCKKGTRTPILHDFYHVARESPLPTSQSAHSGAYALPLVPSHNPPPLPSLSVPPTHHTRNPTPHRRSEITHARWKQIVEKKRLIDRRHD